MSRHLGRRFEQLRIEKGYTLDALAQAVSTGESEEMRGSSTTELSFPWLDKVRDHAAIIA